MKVKSLGIIGGVGFLTSADFYTRICVDMQKLAKVRPLVVHTSVPISCENEKKVFEKNNLVAYKPILIKEAKRLEKSGVDMVCMVCNTLHFFENDIKKSIKKPFVSILDSTVEYIKLNKFKKVGIISTGATLKNKIYETKFIKNKIDFIIPSQKEIDHNNQIISRICDGKLLDSDRKYLEDEIKSMVKQGADCIALACTDLQMLKPKGTVHVFDTMSVLEKKIVKLMCKK